MEGETKRQWMQTFEGRIRIGPEFQATIPPFCRPTFPSSQQNLSNPAQEQPNQAHVPEEFMQSYTEDPDDDVFDTDITSHLKFASKEDEESDEFVGDSKSLEASLNASDSESHLAGPFQTPF